MDSSPRPLDDDPRDGATQPTVPEWLPASQTLVGPQPEIVPGEPGETPTGPKRRPSRALRAAVLVAVLAAGIAVAVIIGDWATRTAEMDRLLDGIEVSEAAMTSAMDDVRTVIGEGGILGDGEADEAAGRLERTAAQARDEVEDAAEQIEALAIQPWHAELLAAREAYLAHNQAWQDYLTEAAEDSTRWFEDAPEIESTWDALGPILTDALPRPTVANLDERVERILDDGSQSDDSSNTIQAAARPAA